ncbi:MAG: hypothetical protein J6X58_05575, partial [Bacteroidales bacterium]|nr:hypothetical protein [Bacteroidales bacterium]
MAFENGGFPRQALARIVVGILVWNAADRMAPVALHLHLAGPSQKEEVAESAIAALAYHHMEAALHHV